MDDRRFACGLNIAACYLRMLADELSTDHAPSDCSLSTQRLSDLRRNLECCALILESLQTNHRHLSFIQNLPDDPHSFGWLISRGQNTVKNLIWLSYSRAPCSFTWAPQAPSSPP